MEAKSCREGLQPSGPPLWGISTSLAAALLAELLAEQ